VTDSEKIGRIESLKNISPDRDWTLADALLAAENDDRFAVLAEGYREAVQRIKTLKSMCIIEMMCENLSINQWVTEHEKRLEKAEKELASLKQAIREIKI
jgi:hypothetical protein